MSDIAVSVRGLSKRYRIAHDREPYARLTETLWNTVRHPFRRGAETEEFWALRDVSFDVTRGDVVGIIGRNGAGKSTLLKILSRITEPTQGEAILRGRVSSLLEVGTGFHPELTGRENIYLSGSILGMSRSDIRRRFEEIVAFAEVERFLDTPVKRYSSGMQVRLGFAVAAHLEPDILVVDEVLAVGDAAFQKKCLAKMEDVAHGGRTVLFVSHNMAAVETLCNSGIVLDSGVAGPVTDAKEAVTRYLASASQAPTLSILDRSDRKGDGRLRILRVDAQMRTGEPSSLRFEYVADQPLPHVSILVGIYTMRGEGTLWLSTDVTGSNFEEIPARGILVCSFDRGCLMPGRYTVNVHCSVGGTVADYIADAAVVDVQEGDFFATGKLPPPGHGSVLVQHKWSVESAS